MGLLNCPQLHAQRLAYSVRLTSNDHVLDMIYTIHNIVDEARQDTLSCGKVCRRATVEPTPQLRRVRRERKWGGQCRACSVSMLRRGGDALSIKVEFFVRERTTATSVERTQTRP